MIIAFLIVLALATVWLIMMACRGLYHLVQQAQMRTELDQMFRWFWDGTPEDRLYAWYKVRRVLEHRNDRKQQHKVAYVDQRIMKLDKKILHGRYSVDSSGRLLNEHQDVIYTR